MTVATALAACAGVVAAVAVDDLAFALARRRRTLAWRRVLVAAGRRLGAPDPPADLAERLDAAGAPLTVADAMALKAGGALAGLLGALAPATGAPGRLGPLVAAAGAAAGFAALDVWLLRRRRARVRAIAIELPDVLDLLRVVLEAGLPPVRALQEVGRRHGGVLAAELRAASARAAAGAQRAQALAVLRRRAPGNGVAALIAVLERAERLGAPPAEALAALASDARDARARERAERAARAAPKIQLVVALLLVPSVMALVAAALAPALLKSL